MGSRAGPVERPPRRPRAPKEAPEISCEMREGQQHARAPKGPHSGSGRPTAIARWYRASVSTAMRVTADSAQHRGGAVEHLPVGMEDLANEDRRARPTRW